MYIFSAYIFPIVHDFLPVNECLYLNYLFILLSQPNSIIYRCDTNPVGIFLWKYLNWYFFIISLLFHRSRKGLFIYM